MCTNNPSILKYTKFNIISILCYRKIIFKDIIFNIILYTYTFQWLRNYSV